MERKVKIVDPTAAFHCKDLETFMRMVFPEKWDPIIARILETGAYFEETDKFAPRWTSLPFTLRKSKTGDEAETHFKSMIFRVHDCLHQLWGLPVPKKWDEDEFYYLKRMWMCAEVAVLTLTEFFYCQWLYDTQPHLRKYLVDRNTLLFKNTTLLRDRTPLETANILDELLHKKIQPKWVRENKHGLLFVEDYVPMLEQDRLNIDWNWHLLLEQENKDYLQHIPTQRYNRTKTGREFTEWMIKDFHDVLETGTDVDWGMAQFNQGRRHKVNLPDGWNSPPSGWTSPYSDGK